jgi:cytochrome b subunit of formate dehydrogenase
MRRVLSIAMVIAGLVMAITGIWKFFPPFDTEFFPPHVISAFVFTGLVIIHIWLNRKPLIRYFK